MKVETMMSQDVATIEPEADFASLLCRHLAGHSRQIYVTDAQQTLLGVISSYDVLKMMIPDYLDSNLAKAVIADEAVFLRRFAENKRKRAGEIMTVDFDAVRLGDTLLEVDAHFKERGHVALPVLDKMGRLVGEITRKDILRYLAQLCEQDRLD